VSSFVRSRRVGISAHDVGKRFGFAYAVSSAEEVLDDANVNLVVIGTRHDTHAELAARRLERNKHVFVEKPLALNDEQLESVLEAAQFVRETDGRFNRRFSPLAHARKSFSQIATRRFRFLSRERRSHPKEHWTQNAEEGGGGSSARCATSST
jgi:polar amino acid transport system substrate-binding protein